MCMRSCTIISKRIYQRDHNRFLETRMGKDIELKKNLLLLCQEEVNRRIDAYKKAMDAAQSAANEQGRSTAGDKYDTARAMSQIDRNMYAKQLSETSLLQRSLTGIQVEKKLEKIGLGAIIQTSQMTYFIAASLGKIECKGKEFIVISPMTPLAQAMLNKRSGDSFNFNKSNVLIQSVY